MFLEIIEVSLVLISDVGSSVFPLEFRYEFKGPESEDLKSSLDAAEAASAPTEPLGTLA